MIVKQVKEGLLIPTELLRQLGEEVEVIVKPSEIIIRPKVEVQRILFKIRDVKEYSNRALLEFVKKSEGWQGDDLEELLEEIS